MNPEKPSPPPDDFETKITALLLGELAPADADAVQQAIAADPALAAIRDRLQQALPFVRQAVTPAASPATAAADQPRLSAKRRKQLLRHFKVITPPELASVRWPWWRWVAPMGAAAAVILLVGVSLVMPRFAHAPKMAALEGRMLINQLGGEGETEMLRARVDPVPEAPAASPPGEVDRRIRGYATTTAEAPPPTSGRSDTEWFMRAASDAGLDHVSTERASRGETRAGALPVAPATAAPSAGATQSTAKRMTEGKEAGTEQNAPRPMMEVRNLMRYGLLPKGMKLVESGEYGGDLEGALARVQKDEAASLAEGAAVRKQSSEATPGSPASTSIRGDLRQLFDTAGEPRAEAEGQVSRRRSAEPAAPAKSELAPLPLKLPLPAFMGTPTDFAIADTAAKGQEQAEDLKVAATGIDGSAPAQSVVDPATGLPVQLQANRKLNFFAELPPQTEEKFGGFAGMGGNAAFGAGTGGGGIGGGGMAAGFAGGRSAGEAVLGQQAEDVPRNGDPVLRRFRDLGRGLVTDSPAGAPPPEPDPGPAVDGDAASGRQQLGELRQRVLPMPGLVATPPPATPAPAPVAGTPLASMGRAEGERFAAGAYHYGTRSQEEVAAAWGDSDNDGTLDLSAMAGVKKVAEAAKYPVLGDVPMLGTPFRAAAREAEAVGGVDPKPAERTESLGFGVTSAGKPVQLALRPARPAPSEDRAQRTGVEELARKLNGSERGRTVERLAEAEGRADPSQAGETGGVGERGLALRGSAARTSRSAGEPASANALGRSGRAAAPATTLADTATPAAPVVTHAVVADKFTVLDEGVALAPEEKVASRPLAPPPEPQPEVATAQNQFSTFSLNVTDVSFKLAAASLEKGALPDASRIRSEEFLNAFNYRDPEPVRGAPIAFAWERARYPFAHNREAIRFSVQTAARGRGAAQPLNLVLLLDSSGSMERADRVSIIREALGVLAQQLKPQDRMSVVSFARTARLWMEAVPGNQAQDVVERVSHLTPEGGTNLEDALKLAYETASRHFLSHGINRVVLLTDGAANLGDVDPASLQQRVEAARKQGIALDCFGIGWEGYNDDLLEVLSSHGDGRYGFINSPEEAATEFAGQLAGALQAAATDVKVQVEFNPYRATAWRQIGYAKHQLTKEQFRDNTVDAAELGAAESGNALYLLEVNPLGQGDLGTVRVRYREPASGLYREHAWRVPYTGPAPLLEQSSPAMRLAVTAAAFAEWLATSPFAGEVNPNRLLGTLSGVADAFGPDERPKQLEAMIRQAQSISGQ